MTPPVPEIRPYRFEDDGHIPNNPDLPLLVYRQALPETGADGCRELFRSNGWTGSWVGGVFSYHHYHSTAHEVLGVVSGGAHLTFGGESGTTVEVRAGDAVVIPAGVGHRNAGSDGGFRVVGPTPKGKAGTC
jgi:uncharacterized protein YjlB